MFAFSLSLSLPLSFGGTSPVSEVFAKKKSSDSYKKTQRVKSYTKKDGKYVDSYTRKKKGG